MPVAGGLWAFCGLWCGCGAKQTSKANKQGLGAWFRAVRCGGAVLVYTSKGLAWFGAVLSAMVGCKV